MEKTYIINDVEYNITNCTAIALNAGDTERQDALLIENTVRHAKNAAKMPAAGDPLRDAKLYPKLHRAA